jgi:hypothetical protein
VRAAVLVLIAFLGTAAADPNSDDALAQADALAKSGDFLGAAGKFKLAAARDPRPELICNVGVAYYKAKQLPRAQLFLNRCLERGTALDPKFVDSVRTVLKSVETSLRAGEFTPVDIVVEPAGASVTIAAFGDDEGFIGSRVVWLARGKQTLVARAEGYVAQTIEIDAQGRELQPVKISLQRTPSEPATGGGVTSPHSGSDDGSGAGSAGSASTGTGSASTPAPAPRPVAHQRPSKLPAIVATSVSLASLALVIVGYQRGHDRAELAKYALSAEVYADDKSAVTKWNTVMLTGAALGVVSAGVAGYLWSRAFRSSAIEIQTSTTSIAISGRW